MKKNILSMMAVALLVVGLAACGGKSGKAEATDENAENNTSESVAKEDPYAWFIPDSTSLFGAVPLNTFNASFELYEKKAEKNIAEANEISDRFREFFLKEGESLKGKVIPTEAEEGTTATIREPFTITSYEISAYNTGVLMPSLNIRAKIDTDPSVDRSKLTLVGYENDTPLLVISRYGVTWAGRDNMVNAPVNIIAENAGFYSRLTKIVVVKNDDKVYDLHKSVERKCANAIQSLHEERPGQYKFEPQKLNKPAITFENGKVGPIKAGELVTSLPKSYDGLYDKYVYEKRECADMDGEWTEDHYIFYVDGQKVIDVWAENKKISAITLLPASSFIKTPEGFYVGCSARDLFSKKRMEWSTYYDGYSFATSAKTTYYMESGDLINNTEVPNKASDIKSDAKIVKISYSIYAE